MRGLLLLALWAAYGQTSVAVIAHRGAHQRHPENTLAAFQAAIEAGADFIEVDVRTSADGRLVVIHDATVDSQTNGKGAVREMSLAQLRVLDVRGSKIPTFDEVLALARGKIGVYVDSKDLTAAALVAALDKHGMRNEVVVYGGLRYLREVAALAADVKVMPESVSVEVCERLVKELRPKVIAFGAGDFTDAIIAVARRAGAGIYVDRLGAADTPEFWEDAVRRGATGIQTDKPGELVRYLRSRGYR